MNRGKFILGVMALLSLVGLYAILGKYLLLLFAGYLIVKVVKMGRGIKNTRLSDWINPKKWMDVLWSNLFKELFPFHVIEQMVLRFYDKEVLASIKDGKFISCGCPVPDRMYVLDSNGPDDLWGPILYSKEKYELARKEYPINISVEYIEKKGVNSRVRRNPRTIR